MRALFGILHLGMLFSCATQALAAERAQEINRDALRHIVEDECVVHWLQRLGPAPCESVSPSVTHDNRQGYAVLADIKGGAHFLLIPTTTVSGIESASLIAPDAPNYFAAAWQARAKLAAVLHHHVARSHIGLAVNSQHARTQDQLHIHIECLGLAIYRVLAGLSSRLNATWSAVDVAGRGYQGVQLLGETLEEVNPFRLLAERMSGAREDMGDYTLLVAGMQFSEGPGFIVLAGKNVPGAPTYLDSTCAIEHGSF